MTTNHAEIRQFVVENFLYGQKDKQLSDHESFLESGIIDSTGVLELIAFLESRYEITIDDEELVPANLDSVERVSNFVGRKLQVKASGVAAG